MRLHCPLPSPIFSNKCLIKRRYIVLADSSQSRLPPLRNPKPLPAPSPPKQPSSPPPPRPPLHFLQKPSPLQFPTLPTDSTPPFVNLFNALNSSQQSYQEKEHESAHVTVEYYDPKPGDFVVGVVLSGNEKKLDVSIGSDMLGSMLAKEALPFCKEEVNGLVCDLKEEREKGLFDKAKVGILRDEEGFREKGEEERGVMEAGTVVFAEVFGRTLGGRPLLSCRRLFRRIAWHRVRQDMMNLKPGTLLQGTVNKIFSYGAQVAIGDTIRSGLLHISNISQSHVTSTSDVLKVGEEVKVLVIKSMFADKIYLSIAELESEPGLFLSNKERVYAEAEEMAKQYKKRILDLPLVPSKAKADVPDEETPPFDDEASLYANWKWFKFEHLDEIAKSTTVL
ncbi:protein PIGMENT DEFECTIVE 338, chloroplastic-like isoform X2 [Carex rostrata]